MNLEPIIWSEVSQKEKNKYYIYIYILERWYWWIYLQGSNGANRPLDLGGREEGEGEIYVESHVETYMTMCKIDSQWEFAVWLRIGKEVQEGGDMGVPMADSCWYLTENNKIL